MKQLLFLYNPHAGRQRVKTMLSDLFTVFTKHDYQITVRPTLAAGEATTLTTQLAPGYDRLVCCGGDGTLNEVVQGLLELPPEVRPVLGYIPTGTTNDFSRNLNLPKSVEELAAVACEGEPCTLDIGRLNQRHFLYVAAFGLFTDVAYSTPQTSKNILGHFAYILEGAGRLVNFPSYHMQVTSEKGLYIEGDFIYGMVSNTISVGGLLNLPRDRVHLDDGKFEVLLIREPKTPKDWQSILTTLTTQKLPEDGSVVAFSCSQVDFTTTAPVSWTVDGEFGGEHTQVQIENIPRTLMIAGNPYAAD